MSTPQDSQGRRIAVVLFNLGGPDGPDSVRPFLFNLFNDPAIIGLPGLFRTALARLISSRREKSAQANYNYMGGGSPLLPGTEAQAEALEQAGRDGGGVVLVPIAFVSEHIETLVELDIEYRELAEEYGIHPYIRVPTVSVTPAFISGLAEGVIAALDRSGTAPFGPGCQAVWKACPCQAEQRQRVAA